MPPLTAEFRRSTGPATSNDSSRASRWRKTVSISTPGEVRAHAEVLAEAEREVRVRVAVDAERERVVEHLLVAVRRRRRRARRCSPARILTPRTSASSVAMRVKWMIGLTQRRISSTASGSRSGSARSFSHCVAVLGEREQAAADRVAGGLVAGLDDAARSTRGAACSVSGCAVDLGRDELAHEVVAGSRRRSFDQLAEVGVQLAAARRMRLTGRLAGAAELRIVLADHLVGPVEEQLASRPRARRGSTRSRRSGAARRRARRSRTRSPPSAVARRRAPRRDALDLLVPRLDGTRA